MDISSKKLHPQMAVNMQDHVRGAKVMIGFEYGLRRINTIVFEGVTGAEMQSNI